MTEEEWGCIDFKPVKMTKVEVNPLTQDTLFLISKFQSECNSNCRLESFLPELNPIQHHFIETARANYKFICSDVPPKTFEKEGSKLQLQHQLRTLLTLSEVQKGIGKVLLILREEGLPGFFYFAFIAHELLSQKILYVSLKTLYKPETCLGPLDHQTLIAYLNTESGEEPVLSLLSKTSIATNPSENAISPSSSATTCYGLKLKRKLSKDQRHDQMIQKEIENFEWDQEGLEIKNFLDQHADKVSVPAQISKVIDRIPILYQKYIFQGMLKNIGRIACFADHVKKVIKNIVKSDSKNLASLFTSHEQSRKNILNQPCAPEFRIHPFDAADDIKFFDERDLDGFSKGHDVQEDSYRPDPYEPLNYSEQSHPNGLQYSQEALEEEPEVVEESNQQPVQFTLKRSTVSEEVREIMIKIRKVLVKNKLQIRSLQLMAEKFIESRNNNTLTLDLAPQDLPKLKICVGKYYYQVLHPLYMKELEKYQSKYHARSFQKYIEKTVEEIKGKMDSCEEDIPSLKQMTRFEEKLSLRQFCELINSNQETEKCCKVNIPLRQYVAADTVMKFSKQGGCIFILIEDLTHQIDSQIILSRFQAVTPQKILKHIQTDTKKPFLYGSVLPEMHSFEKIGEMVEEAMVNNQNDYLTLMYGQLNGNRKLSVLIKVRRVNSLDRLVTLKIGFRVIIGKSDYDVKDAYIYRMSSESNSASECGDSADEEQEEQVVMIEEMQEEVPEMGQ